jgi:uncharacterized protein (TIGR04168 family)
MGEKQPEREPELEIAVAGDLHDQWDERDNLMLERLAPDALLLVGDFSDGRGRIPRLLSQLSLPIACVLGNHDAGKDPSGHRLRRQLDLLGDRHCGWGLRQLTPPGLAVVGARPGTAGGGYRLSKAVRAAFGPVDLQESAARISAAAAAADPALPLLLLAHCGPSGLGSEARDLCGRDWKKPACDWGDQDLALAIERIRRQRPVPLVVFGHMHHTLRRQQGERRSVHRDRQGTLYLNAAFVPRHGEDQHGRRLRHLSWIRWRGARPVALAHRWYGDDGFLLYEQHLWSEPASPEPAIPESCAPAAAPPTEPTPLSRC